MTKFFEVHIGSDQAPRLFCVEGKCHDYDPRHFVNYVVELGIVLVDCDDFFINKSLVSPRRATNCGSVWPDWGCSGVGPFGQLLHSTLQLVRGDMTPRLFGESVSHLPAAGEHATPDTTGSHSCLRCVGKSSELISEHGPLVSMWD